MANLPNGFNAGWISRLFEDVSLLFSLLKDLWKGVYRDVSFRSVMVFFGAILYVLLPTDLIPDFVPGLGQIDDAAVLVLCLKLLEKDLFRYKEWKKGGL